MSVRNGFVESAARATEYSVLEETLARRTYQESGDYIVSGFDIDMREHYNDGLNDGVYTTAEGGDPSKIVVALSPGKAFVRGYEIETIAQTFVPLAKARETEFVQNNPTTFSAGNFARVENVYGTPDLGADGSDSKPFKEVELRDQRMPVTHLTEDLSGGGSAETGVDVDSTERMPISGTFYIQVGNEIMQVTSLSGNTLTVVRGYLGTDAVTHTDNDPVYVWGMNNITSISPNFGAENGGLARRAKTIGVARTRAYEVSSSATATLTGAHPRTSQFEHYLFDVRMLTKLTMNAASKFTATNWLQNGAKIKGSISGATGIVYITAQDI